MSLDLSTLPVPRVIEEVDFEAIVDRQVTKFKERWALTRAAHPELALPDYDVQMLETDPAVILNEAESFREILLRARINDAARANLLVFAAGTDLDHLAAFYGVERIAGEPDVRLRQRVVLAIQGRSTGGTVPRYKYVAMTASLQVADVKVYPIGRGPEVHVAVYSAAGDGVASPQLLALVSAALNDQAVRMVNDVIVVASAVQTVVNLAADVWLLPDTDEQVIEQMEAALRSGWALERALGRDLVQAWWVSRLMIGGVHKVAPLAPAGDVIANPYEAISIGTVDLQLKGRQN